MRIFIALAAVATLAGPLAAQTHVDASGPTSGRSPHKIMREVSRAPSCGKTMHSIPAGKLPTYGTHAMESQCPNAVTLAMTDGKKARAANRVE